MFTRGIHNLHKRCFSAAVSADENIYPPLQKFAENLSLKTRNFSIPIVMIAIGRYLSIHYRKDLWGEAWHTKPKIGI
jgi:hypothetical protein